MIHAAMSGDVAKVRQLLADGADVNFANRLGMTALMVAAQWNRLEIVNFLLSKGADVKAEESPARCNTNSHSKSPRSPPLIKGG